MFIVLDAIMGNHFRALNLLFCAFILWGCAPGTVEAIPTIDNPGGPKGFIGGPGTPRLIEDVVDKVAELRSANREEIISLVQSNLLHLIGDDPWFMDADLAIFDSRINSA